MSGDADSLPLAHVKRIVRSKLAELSGSVAEGGKKKEVSVQKEALTAFAEAAKIFIHYLTGTANELCHEGKRLTVNAEDVLRALEEVEFAEFAGPLREALAGAQTEGGKRCGAEPGSYAPPPPPRTAQDSRRRLRRRRERGKEREGEKSGAGSWGCLMDSESVGMSSVRRGGNRVISTPAPARCGCGRRVQSASAAFNSVGANGCGRSRATGAEARIELLRDGAGRASLTGAEFFNQLLQIFS